MKARFLKDYLGYWCMVPLDQIDGFRTICTDLIKLSDDLGPTCDLDVQVKYNVLVIEFDEKFSKYRLNCAITEVQVDFDFQCTVGFVS